MASLSHPGRRQPSIRSTGLISQPLTGYDAWFIFATMILSWRFQMKGKKTDLRALDCGIARSLAVIGDWWSLLILRDAFRGLQRFGEFQRSLGLAKNILS